MKDPAFTVVGGDVMPFTWGMGSPSTSTLEVKSGETYVIYNANKVDSQSIANELFNEETPWTDGLQGHGICNPDFTVAFNIDPVIITVESVDPAPYVEGGEYSKEIPAEIKITLSGENAKVNSALVTYGMNTRVPAEAKVEGKVITVTVPEAALAENNIGVLVSAVNEMVHLSATVQTVLSCSHIRCLGTYSFLQRLHLQTEALLSQLLLLNLL